MATKKNNVVRKTARKSKSENKALYRGERCERNEDDGGKTAKDYALLEWLNNTAIGAASLHALLPTKSVNTCAAWLSSFRRGGRGAGYPRIARIPSVNARIVKALQNINASSDAIAEAKKICFDKNNQPQFTLQDC